MVFLHQYTHWNPVDLLIEALSTGERLVHFVSVWFCTISIYGSLTGKKETYTRICLLWHIGKVC